MASIARRSNGSYEARYRPVPGGPQIRRCFRRKVDAQHWLNEQTAALVTGTHVHPTTARITVAQWGEQWLAGYGTRRPSTVRQARVHLAQITAAFGDRPLGSLRPSDIKAWTAALRAEGTADSYVYALHNRVAQLMSDAVHDGLIARSPCSRRTSPPAGRQRPYVASTEQVRALHEVFPTHLRPAVLLGAYAGLRTAEVVGLRRGDVDLEAGVVCPVQQAGGLELKTAMSRTPVPVPRRLAEALLTPRDGVLEDGALDGLTLPQKPHNPQNPEPPGILRLLRFLRRPHAPATAYRTPLSSPTRPGSGRRRPGRSSGRSGQPARKSRAYPRGSATTTCGTTTPRC
jgi:integrase